MVACVIWEKNHDYDAEAHGNHFLTRSKIKFYQLLIGGTISNIRGMCVYDK